MQSKKESKFASYRVFELLKFLTLSSASIDEIIQHMEFIDPENKSFSMATVYKYLTTLKTMGIGVFKTKGKFHINKLPFVFDFNKNDIRAIKLLENLEETILEKKTRDSIQAFVGKLLVNTSEEMKEYYNNVTVEDIILPRKYNDNEKEMIEIFEKYLEDSFSLKVTYKNDKNEIETKTLEAVCIVFRDSNIFFKMLERRTGDMIDIQLEKIIEMVQTPLKASKRYILSTTTFKIKGKLIKRYVLKEGEKVTGFDDDGNLLVVNQYEDKNRLIKRLLGYGILCEVLSSNITRNVMIEELDEIIKNYNNT